MKRNACIEALKDSTLVGIPYSVFQQLKDEYVDMKDLWIYYLENSLAYKLGREYSFLAKNATQRYMEFRRDYPNLEKEIPQKYIASYLGISPVSLSRIRHSMV